MGYNDDRRFPDFTFVSGDEPLTDYLDAVIISHFHLDHCGALPFMTEMVGYNGPIYMTGKQCTLLVLIDFCPVKREFLTWSLVTKTFDI